MYIGRFAPSPTGPLHFGSLVAAAASYIDARTHGGSWLVRMEDVDLPRCVPGAAADILRTLEGFGFEWHGEVIYQSSRTAAYGDALERLRHAGLAYPCDCSRKDVGRAVYPGTCRSGMAGGPGRLPAWRVLVGPHDVEFDDRARGMYRQNVASEVGDFVVLRADGLFAYQLAVVVDDAAQGVTDVVRGADLLDSTPRQIWLQRALGLPTPRYLHVPVAVNGAGEKLSKQTLAPPIQLKDAAREMRRALRFLGLNAGDARESDPRRVLAAAVDSGRNLPHESGPRTQFHF